VLSDGVGVELSCERARKFGLSAAESEGDAFGLTGTAGFFATGGGCFAAALG